MPLGELCRPKQWKSLKQSDMTKSGFPVYGANGIIGHYSEYNHADETILIGCRGTCGEVNVCQPKSYVTSNAMCLDGLSECVDKQFLFCFLKAYDFRKVIGGTSQPQITKSGVSSIEVPLFPLEDQRRITLRLLSVLKVIENRRTLLGKLDSLVKSRFVEMFGDPGINSKRLPVAKLSELGQLERGRSKHRPRNDPRLLGGPYPLVQTGDIAKAGLYLTKFNETYSEFGLQQSRLWPKGTMCITIAANIAKTAILEFDACFPDSVVGFTPNEKVLNVYMCYWFDFFQGVLESQAPQAAQKNINLRILSNLDVSLPSMDEQKIFADFVAQVDKSRFAGAKIGTMPVKNYAENCTVHNKCGCIPNKALHDAKEVAEYTLLKLQELYDSLTRKYFAL